MAKVKCPECSGKVSATLKACPHCGLVMPSAAVRQFLYLFLRCFAAVCVGGVLVFWLMPQAIIEEFHGGMRALEQDRESEVEDLKKEFGARLRKSELDRKETQSRLERQVEASKNEAAAARVESESERKKRFAANEDFDQKAGELEVKKKELFWAKKKIAQAEAMLERNRSSGGSKNKEDSPEYIKEPVLPREAENVIPEETVKPEVALAANRFEAIGKNKEGYPEYRHRQTGIVFISLPGGPRIGMGSPEGEDGRHTDEKYHIVSLSPFLIAKHEVTQLQWKKVMGIHFSIPFAAFSPVNDVTNNEIEQFLTKSGLELPTEAQWEYACRGGSTGPYSGKGIRSLAWFEGNALGPRSVGLLAANPFGLYDMHGNVWERCRDVYSATFYSNSGSKDPVNLGVHGAQRMVTRGGCWKSPARFCRSAYRSYVEGGKSTVVGFRPAFKFSEEITAAENTARQLRLGEESAFNNETISLFAKERLERVMNFVNKGEFDKAIDECTQVLIFNPRYIEAYILRGLAYQGKHEHAMAITDFSVAQSYAPRTNPFPASYYRVFYYRGISYVSEGRFPAAIDDFSQAILLKPEGLPYLYLARMRAYKSIGEEGKADADFQKAKSEMKKN